MKRPHSYALTLRAGSLALLASLAGAQSNLIPGTDVELGILGNLSTLGRQGGFPNGVNGLAMSTTSCNPGAVNVPWLAPMQENHPLISFLVVRESNGRMEQISDRSFVKHGFFALSNSQCTPCQNPSNGTFLGVGCSDTYGTGNNGDNYWLAPADEIDPWLGTWTAQCSYFDMGNPPVNPNQQCDTNRSFSSGQASALGPVGSRINITDADLNTPGTFFYQGHYTILGEPVGNRFNNTVSRRFIPTWNGSTWQTNEPGTQLDGSVLQRWSTLDGIDRASNGSDNGFVWVAASVTQPSAGVWHYEYAIHNVDNSRGIGALRIPLGPNTTVSNFGFSDIDGNGGNDWVANAQINELVFATGSNPLRWNTIYNIWFDSNTAPMDAVLFADQFDAGPGSTSIALNVVAPFDGTVPNFYCIPKISSIGCISTITTTIPGLNPVSGANDYSVSALNVQGTQNGLLFYGISGPASIPFQGGTLCVQPPLGRTPIQNAGGSGPLACDGGLGIIVNDGNIVPLGPDAGSGNSSWMQAWYRDPAGSFGIALTDAVQLDFF